MSKYWYIEDGQVCWRTPYADLRGCDYTMLVACLNERDEKIADLKKQLADVKNSCDYYMKRSNDLVLKLAEKDKLIDVYADEHAMLQCKIADLVVKEIKTEDKFKRQLEEKDNRIRKLNLEAQQYFEDAYCNDFQDQAKTDFAIEQLEKVKEVIDNQIKELRG